MICNPNTRPPPRRRKLQSGDRSHCAITHINFKSAAIFIAYIPETPLDTSRLQTPQPQSSSQPSLVHGLGVNRHKLVDMKKPKSFFHHYIPRFVLKGFIPYRTVKEARCNTYSRIGRYEDYIYYYPISSKTGKIDTRPISRAYGAKGLYKSPGSPDNPHALEEEFSRLENRVSRIITNIHGILGEGAKENKMSEREPEIPTTFRVQRREFNLLNQFLFTMGCRKASLTKTHWQQDNPENARLKSWIQEFADRNNITRTPTDIWLYQLNYLLRTPHCEIVDHGRKAMRGLLHQILEHPHSAWGTEIDPGLKHLEAIDYMVEADGCYLGIWEAALGEEFIISSNSFGIVEGEGIWGPLHRFYVISPRIALVVFSVGLDPNFTGNPEIKRRCQDSIFLDATHKPPKVEPAVEPPRFENYYEKLEFEAKRHTRLEDWMEFEVSRLSVEHTHIVNAIILGNVNDGGKITFRSEEALIRTLDSFRKNEYFSNQSRYDLLLRGLREKVGGSIQPNTPPTPEEGLHSNDRSCRDFGQECSEIDHVQKSFGPITLQGPLRTQHDSSSSPQHKRDNSLDLTLVLSPTGNLGNMEASVLQKPTAFIKYILALTISFLIYFILFHYISFPLLKNAW